MGTAILHKLQKGGYRTMSRKKIWVSAVLLVSLVVVGVGLASAQGNGPQQPPGIVQQWNRPQVRHSQIFPIARDMLKAIADKLGMSVKDLEKEVRAGKSILVVADEKGVSRDDLIKAAVDSQEERLQKAVDDGRITAGQKSWIEQKIGEKIGDFLDRQGVGRLAFPAFTKDEWEAIADKLGMDARDLGKELQGRSLAAVAEEKGVSLDDLTKAAADARKAALDEKVKDGHITQAQADAALSDFQEHLNKCVENGEGLSCGWGARRLVSRFSVWHRAKSQATSGRNRAFGKGGRAPGGMQGQSVPVPGWRPMPRPHWGCGLGWAMPEAPGSRPMPRPWGNAPAPRK